MIIDVPTIRCLRGVDEHEDVFALLRIFDVAGEASLREVDDLADRVAIVGQVDGVEVAGDGEELVFVRRCHAADLVADHDLACACVGGSMAATSGGVKPYSARR